MLRVFIWILIAYIQVLPSTALCADIRGVILEGKLESVIPGGAKWAVSMFDMNNGKEIVNIGNSDSEALVPASLVKLFVSGAALGYAEKNGGLDMTTTIAHDGLIKDGVLKGNLYMLGRGNAFLSGKDIMSAAEEIAGKGIRIIEGDIVADDTLFEGSGIKRRRRGPAYAPPSALGIDLHTVAIAVMPSNSGSPPQVSISPADDSVSFSVTAKTVPGVRNTIRIKKISDASYIIEGNIPEGSGLSKKRFVLDDPALYVAAVMKTALKSAGVALKGNMKKGKSPHTAKKLAEMKAPALSKIIKDMNINSLNVMADNILLLLGAERFGVPGTAEKGIKAVEEFLVRVRGVEEARGLGIKLYDGSGLSGENRVTAAYLARYLQAIAKEPWFAEFKESLPRAGMDGSLKRLKYKNPAFRVKTGRLEEAYGLAGYGVDNHDRHFAFAYMVNGNRGEIMAVERSGAMVMETLAGE